MSGQAPAKGFMMVKVRLHVYQWLSQAREEMQAAWNAADPTPGRKARVSFTDVVEALLYKEQPAVKPRPRQRRKKKC